MPYSLSSRFNAWLVLFLIMLNCSVLMPCLLHYHQGFYAWLVLFPDNSKLKLAAFIKSHKLWFQPRTLLLTVPQADKMSVSKSLHYFSSHWVAFGFWASLSPDNITLNLAYKRTDLSLSGLQTGIGAAAYATFTQSSLFLTLGLPLLKQLPLHRVFYGGVIAVSEM